MPTTKLEKLKFRLENNPILAILMVLGVIVIGISTFTDATKNLLDLVLEEERPEINGEWTVEVDYPGRSETYIETFNFDGEGDGVNGSATYLGKEQVIVDGKVEAGRIQFQTKTLEYAPDWNNDKMKLATHQYRGTLSGDKIRFLLETSGGYSSDPPVEFTARRVLEQK